MLQHALNYLNWPDTYFLIDRGSCDYDVILKNSFFLKM